MRKEIRVKLSPLRQLPCGHQGESHHCEPWAGCTSPLYVCESTGRKSGCTTKAHDCGGPRRDWGGGSQVCAPGAGGEAAVVASSACSRECTAQERGHPEEGGLLCFLRNSQGLKAALWTPDRKSGTQAGPAGSHSVRNQSQNNEGLSSF